MEAGSIIIAMLAGLLAGAGITWYVMRGRGAAEFMLLREQRADRDMELAQQRTEVVRLTGELAASEQVNAGLEEKLADQKRELEQLSKRMTDQFTLVADKLLGEKSEQLNRQQHERLDLLLKPLNERISDFKKKVEETYDREGRERHALKSEIMRLVEQNQRLTTEADNLTRALKGDSKIQGDWGEMILERMLEGSGLVEGQEYTLQTSTTLADGTRMRPDAVIHLPGGKHVVVDAKVSLTHYERYAACTEDAERERFARLHSESIRTHVKGLAQKDYPKLYGINSPEFVLMFVPIEAAFNLAQTTRRELALEAIDQRVFIVTHSTLMASLRLFHSIWKNERISLNHLEIADRAGALYDKFVGFTDDMKKVGQQLNTAQSTYVEAMKKLSSGAGNLIRQTEMLKTLGAKTNKSIDPAFLNRALEEAPTGEA